MLQLHKQLVHYCLKKLLIIKLWAGTKYHNIDILLDTAHVYVSQKY